MTFQKSRMYYALVAVASVLLSGCATMVSKQPLFAPSSFDGSEFLLGTYQTSDSGRRNGEFIVDRSGANGLRIVGLEHDGDNWVQMFYGDGGAIALGGGDYVLQLSCVAYHEKDGWKSADVGPPSSAFRSYTIYSLALKDRRKNDYWILQDAYGISSDLFTRYGVNTVKIKVGDAEDTVDVIPQGVAPETVKSFFRDVATALMAGGQSGPGLMEQTSVDSSLTASDPDETNALTLTTPAACRAIADHGERFSGK
jgi:hypothetical protein